MRYQSSAGNMRCESCATEFEVSAVEAYQNQLEETQQDDMDTGWTTDGGGQWEEGEQVSMHAYVCKSCGGEIMADETTSATHCPYCGNPVVLMEQVSGSLRPDYVIPFKLDKEDAKNAYRRHIKGKILLPKAFGEENHIEEMQSVYVPFWLFDADTDVKIRYTGTKSTTWSTKDYIYTRTDYYSIFRGGDVQFSRVPADGSSRMEDSLMEAIEPFDFNEAVDFKTAYLSGYIADRYDVSLEESVSRANNRIRNTAGSMFRSTVTGFNQVREVRSSIQLKNGHSSYALYPVWILNTKWHDQDFVFAMNGQTGRIAGDLPADPKKVWLFRIGLGVLFAALIYVLALALI